jgi:hypothetical protein
MEKETVCLHPEVEYTISRWIQVREKPAVLLLGPPGIGKTTLALRVYRLAGLRPIEFNASHTRSGTSFRKTILPLLREGGIVQMMESGRKGGIGVLLDEIDGLSNGERGGLSELHAYLKLPEAREGRPLILISNSLDTRTLQQIAKVCLTFEIQPVKPERLQKWLNTDIPENYNGDLRSLQRQIAGLETPNEYIIIPEGVMPIASWTLWGEWDPHLKFDIENNEGNLASLICLENIPERIEKSLGTTEEAWKMYLSLFNAYKVSDQGDFWAFFYQCWTILPISLRLKLKIMSLRLLQEAPLPEGTPVVESKDFRYTPVLTKQSAMFNAWKLICEVAEKYQVPIRLAPLYAHLESKQEGLKPDKVRRYNAISVEHLQSLYEDSSPST